MSTVGGRIKFYRLTKGLTQIELANIADLNVSTIIRYEDNQVEYALEICNRIAQSLEINPKLIYDDYLNFLASDYQQSIRKTRKKLKLTQKEFANLLGLNLSSVRRWESGRAYPSRENYIKLIKLFSKAIECKGSGTAININLI